MRVKEGTNIDFSMQDMMSIFLGGVLAGKMNEKLGYFKAGTDIEEIYEVVY